MKNRFVSFDYLRAFASLVIVFDHLFFAFILNTGWIRDTLTADLIARIPGVIINRDKFDEMSFKIAAIATNFQINSGFFKDIHLRDVGVYCFFLLSGFLMTNSLRKYEVKHFLIARFFRIFPALWFSAFFAMACYCVFFGASINLLNDRIIRSLFLIGPTNKLILSNFWTLHIEVVFYLIMAIFCAIKSKMKWEPLFILFIFALIFVNPEKQYAHLILFNARIFFIGVLINMAYKQKNVYYLAALLAYIYINFIKNFDKFSLTSIAVFLTFFAFNLFFEYKKIEVKDLILKKIHQIIMFFAKISYSLYLLHAPIGWIVLFKVYDASGSLVLAYFSAISAVIILSYLSYELFERGLYTHIFLVKKLEKFKNKIFSWV